MIIKSKYVKGEVLARRFFEASLLKYSERKKRDYFETRDMLKAILIDKGIIRESTKELSLEQLDNLAKIFQKKNAL